MKRNLGTLYLEETEKIVLGGLLTKGEVQYEVDNILNEECFYNDFHRTIFRAIRAVEKSNRTYDMITVWNELRGKIDEVKDRGRYFAIAGNLCTDMYQHAAALKDASARRKIEEKLKYALSKVQSVMEDPLDLIESTTNDLNDIYADQASGVTTLREALEQAYEIVNQNLSNPEPVTGTPTGFRDLDRRGVLRPGNLTVIGADSSQGKTSLATSFCVNAAISGAKIAFYTMEMTPVELAQRIWSKESGVDGMRLASSALTQEELVHSDRGMRAIIDFPLYFDGKSTSTIDSIISSIRMMKKRKDIDGAVVDYLQILSVNGGDGARAEQEMGTIARKLKNVAKDLGIWIMALSQLSRDKLDVAPSIGRIRGSGQITEAADVVMLLYRPEYYGRSKRYPEPYGNVSTENTAMIDIAKGRNVGTWKMICGFNAPTTQFYDLIDIPHIDPLGSGNDKPAF